MAGLYTVAGNGLRWLYDRRLEGPAILDQESNFPAGRRFAESWEGLRDEAFSLASTFERIPRFHEIMRQQTEISANDGRDWRVFVAKAYGTGISRNLAHCPILAGLLDAHPEIVSATYSYLAPGKHIPVHRGPFRGVLRFHLGLSMPLDENGNLGATLWIDGVPRRLADGDTLLWDDTYPHEVMNATGKVRVALLLDVYRPGMPIDLAVLSSFLIATVGAIVRVRPRSFAG